ncbi:UDP-glucose flavonoid 3-O-glucosyltransferase 6-like [Coffea arabica]|uniref:UDP-glucose flavonoid 3-O-glucosyltransferase 6-like n=1 Tax=Coffea arabica TaxID=13443 RepID=A0ABM4UF14_COFAR
MTMIDVVEAFDVPCYVFFTCGAASLGLMFHFETLEDEQTKEISDLVQVEMKLVIPSLTNNVPSSVLPIFTTRKEIWRCWFLKATREYRRAKGILVNTFADLEPHAINSFLMEYSYGTSRLPSIFPIGPVLNTSQIQTQSTNDHSEMMEWMDIQPEKSVVFLCFGSMGVLSWIKQLPAKNGEFAGEFENHGLALPEGFLDRTALIGKVVGWIPQMAILSHPTVGGFVPHCGSNSILEGIWCGVPIAAWPLFGKQQFNAFQLVKELGMAGEISSDFNEANKHQPLAKAEQIEKGIREVMDGENDARKKVKEFTKKCRQAMKEGCSSRVAFENLMLTLCSSLHQASQVLGSLGRK